MLKCETLYLVTGVSFNFVCLKLDDGELTSTVTETTEVRKNAFTILTSAANHIKHFPDKRNEINDKTRMYNDIIECMLDSHKLTKTL